MPYRSVLLGLLAAVLIFPAISIPATSEPEGDPLAEVIAGDWRSDEHRARDQYRHPQETLEFFGLAPGMTIVEVTPGRGWYTEILAPYSKRTGGTFYAAGFDPKLEIDFVQKLIVFFDEHFVGQPEIYGPIKVTALGAGPIAPEGSADLVLTFRNVHNWMGDGIAGDAFQVFHRALKPGGVLGVVQHRGDPELPQDPKAESGYVTEATVIAMAEAAGFELSARSEINANPNDSRDHPEGVWTLPPGFELGDQDREKYAAIGESDRMTLKFRKPLE